METVMSNEAVVVPSPVSAYRIMLTSLSQFQALDWEIQLSRIRFPIRDRLCIIDPFPRGTASSSPSSSKPRLRIRTYYD
jgi:hypothetical protein